SPKTASLLKYGCGRRSISGQAHASGWTRCRRCNVQCSSFRPQAPEPNGNCHLRIDRMLTLAKLSRVPLAFYAEGGRGRPVDINRLGMAGHQLRIHNISAEIDSAAYLHLVLELYDLVCVRIITSLICFDIRPFLIANKLKYFCIAHDCAARGSAS